MGCEDSQLCDYGAVDVSEDYLLKNWPKAFEILLLDHATRKNIFWATDDYEGMGPGYAWHDPIMPDLITGERGHVVMPRILKRKELQLARAKGRAEISTPAWMCNHQNNLIDNEWFGREGVFNTEYVDFDGNNNWHPNR